MKGFTGTLQEMIDSFRGGVRSIFLSYKNDGYYDQVIQACTRTNVRRLVPTILLVILVECSNIIIDSINNPHKELAPYYLGACALLIAAMLVFIPPVSRALNTSELSLKRSRQIYYSFWIVLSIGTQIFCALDMIKGNNTVNFIVLMAIISWVAIFQPVEITMLAVFNTVVMVIVLLLFRNEPNLIQQVLCVCAACIVFSCMNFYSFCNIHREHIRISEANGQLRAFNAQLEALSETDLMTQLLNRRGVEKRIEILWPHCSRGGSEIAMMIIDIDWFKMYNDEFGHAMGDDCLVRVAESIRQSVRRDTDIVSRFGGEEFIVIINNISKQNVLALAEDIRRNIELMHLSTSNRSVSDFVTVSLGVSMIKPNMMENSFLDLYKQADHALYQAKNNGRNRVVFHD